MIPIKFGETLSSLRPGAFGSVGRGPSAGDRECPGCHLRVPAGSNFCFRCKHFIDWDSSSVLSPEMVGNDVVDQLLAHTVEAKARYANSDNTKRIKLGKRLMIAGGIMIATLFLAPFGGVALFLGVVLWLSSQNAPSDCMELDDVEDAVDSALVPPLLFNAFEQVEEYRHSKVFPARLIHEAQLMQLPYSDVRGSDYIRAVYRGLTVELGDVELVSRENVHGLPRERTVFKGLFLTCPLGLELAEPVTVWERENRDPLGEGASTGDAAFDARFYVEARHPDTVRRVLTPRLRQYIEQLDTVGDGQTSLKFMPDGRFYLMVASPHDLFELQGLSEPAARLRIRFEQELGRITELLDLLAELHHSGL